MPKQFDMEALERDLARVLNAHGLDSSLHVPDFILAQLVLSLLGNVGQMMVATDVWHGFGEAGDSRWQFRGLITRLEAFAESNAEVAAFLEDWRRTPGAPQEAPITEVNIDLSQFVAVAPGQDLLAALEAERAPGAENHLIHATDCDLDEDCTCGAEDPVAALSDPVLTQPGLLPPEQLKLPLEDK